MIISGDSLEQLKELESDSVDLVVTDPPYGYSFMGKDWDKAVPSVEIWQECLRVLKPGAFCMVMSAPRSDVQMHMVQNLTEAGFRLDFTPIYWTYASGFPKAGNIGKMVDKRPNKTAGELIAFGKMIRAHRDIKGISQRELAKRIGVSRELINLYEITGNRQQQFPTRELWLKIKAELEISADKDYVYEVAEREVIAKTNLTFGYQGDGKGNRWDKGYSITGHASEQAKALDGSYAGFQPKPAVEVIIVAMKPLSEKTFVDQALKNGKGISWLDDARIPTGSEDMGDPNRFAKTDGGWAVAKLHEPPKVSNSGRFPANLLVSDDVLNDGVSRRANGNKISVENQPVKSGFLQDVTTNTTPYSDSGSYSRYFDLDKWWNNLDKSDSKAYNREKNNRGKEWEAKEAVDELGSSNKSTHVNSVASSSPPTPATSQTESISSVPDNVTPNTDSVNPNQSAKSAVRKPDYTATNTAQRSVVTKPDTEALIEILTTFVNELIILTTPNERTRTIQEFVSFAEQNLNISSDITQTCQNLLTSSSYVSPATIELMRSDPDQLWQNLDNLPSSVRITLPFLVCAKASKFEKNEGLADRESKQSTGGGGGVVDYKDDVNSASGKYGSEKAPAKNHHPTVKPIKLMSYLITLGSRPGDIVLDPFCGSGTTIVAAEMLGRKGLGIEREAEYVEIASARLRHEKTRVKQQELI